MTVIKYATIAYRKNANQLTIVRGKKEGRIGNVLTDDSEDNSIFGDPVHSAQVVELPSAMSPSAYENYINNVVGVDEDDPVTMAMIEVAKKKGIDYNKWDWPILEGEDD